MKGWEGKKIYLKRVIYFFVSYLLVFVDYLFNDDIF